jgi:hypothetical protein
VLAAESFTVTPLPAAFQTGPFWDISFDRTPPDPAAIKARDADLALTAAMKIDFTQRTAASFLVPALPHGADWPVLSSKPINIQLVSYDVDQRTTRVVVESNRPTLLRLAHPVFPGIDITRNGVPVSYTSDVFNLAVVPIVAGRNEIVVTVHPSALRRFCVLFTSLIIALLVIGLGQQLAVRPRVATH